ncbi:MAG: glycoside hydrolase family 3 C-terminal domain-containing protein [Christensenellaceae bacterium]|jgi:beta-glucosidase|nr:glycoside hydrolase family 3 C-terminal domain-containing protein [Christensenellaceae bacterium]
MSQAYINTALPPEKRASALLEELSLEEKLAQIVGLATWDAQALDFVYIRENTPYGVGEVSTLEVRRFETLEDVAQWQRDVQTIVMENSPHHIPAIFHMEGMCGAFIQDATSFPAGIARGASFDPELEEAIGSAVSRQEAACGFTRVLAPVLDVARDPRMGRQGECYGEDPALVSAMGTALTRGLQSAETAGRKTDATAKHFVAFHTGQGGIHGAHSEVPTRVLEEVFAKPFQAAITEADLTGVMPCYCNINGEPTSVSKTLLDELLRKKMGFDGTVVSDYGGIDNAHGAQHLYETPADAGLAALEAGMDVELPNQSCYNADLLERFRLGEADMALLDRAVLHELTAKFRMGLFEHPFALEGEPLRQAAVQPRDKELSLRAARESLVLLKNDGVLPLRKVKKIAIIGPHAAYARKMFGGYTHLCMMESVFAVANSIAGVSGTQQADPETIVTIPGTHVQSDETPEFDPILKRQKPDCRSLLEELKTRLPDAEITYAYGYPVAGADESRFGEALEAAQNADILILTLGGKHGTCSMATMGEGVDATNINLPACQDAFLHAAAELGRPMVGVHFDGRPISSDAADRYLSAILECWSPSECGAQAVVDVLLGETSPSGKLPVTVAWNAGQVPLYYNHPWNSQWHQGGSIAFADYVDCPHAPRYYFGHGLSYTKFAYSDLRISASEIAPDGSVEVSFTVANTGDVAGDEVVQLYLCDEYASMARPVKELAGFRRVGLAPGESKTITFTIQASQTAFLDADMRWKVEKGRFVVEVGTSSEDIRLTGEFLVIADGWMDGRHRAFYAKSEVR